MPYGIGHLSVAPVRTLADNASEMLTQILYGDHFKILESRKHWVKIRIASDQMEGWIGRRQYAEITEDQYKAIGNTDGAKYASDLVGFTNNNDHGLTPILLGSIVSNAHILSQQYEGSCLNGNGQKSNLISTALHYLNAPYLKGGKTPFGIDDAALTQMVYRVHGYQLPRLAAQQAHEGEVLSFIEESEAGDLAFFDDKEGNINHVGIIMKDNYIIHSYGKVRIDRLDHTGIFNNEDRRYTHQLRMIKKMI